MPREHLIPDHRWHNVQSSPRLLNHALLICSTMCLCTFILAHAIQTRPLLKVETFPPPLAFANVPCDAQANEPPVAGPFRPRPRPDPPTPVPPAPAPENDAERKLFPRIEALIDARAAKVEARAEARATQRVEEALDEVAANMDSVDVVALMQGETPQVMQGAFGGVFVAKLWAFLAKAVKFLVAGILLTVLGGLIVHYWFIVGPVALFLFVALPAWSARTFQKKA